MTKCPTCSGTIERGQCLLCGHEVYSTTGQDMIKFRTLVNRYHDLFAWQRRQYKKGIEVFPQATLDKFIADVADPLDAEYQRLIALGMPQHALEKIVGIPVCHSKEWTDYTKGLLNGDQKRSDDNPVTPF